MVLIAAGIARRSWSEPASPQGLPPIYVMFSEEIHATEPLPPTVALIEGDPSPSHHASLDRHSLLNFYPGRLWFYNTDSLDSPVYQSPSATVTLRLRPRFASPFVPDATHFTPATANTADCRVFDGDVNDTTPIALSYDSANDWYELAVDPSIPESARNRSAVDLVALVETSPTPEGIEEFGLEIVNVTINDPNYSGSPVLVGSTHTSFRWLITDDQ